MNVDWVGFPSLDGALRTTWAAGVLSMAAGIAISTFGVGFGILTFGNVDPFEGVILGGFLVGLGGVLIIVTQTIYRVRKQYKITPRADETAESVATDGGNE